MVSCNIADTVLTFLVLSSDGTGVQCVPRVELYVTVCSILPNKSSVSLFLDIAVYCSVPLGSKGYSQVAETVRHNCLLNRLRCCRNVTATCFGLIFIKPVCVAVNIEVKMQ